MSSPPVGAAAPRLWLVATAELPLDFAALSGPPGSQVRALRPASSAHRSVPKAYGRARTWARAVAPMLLALLVLACGGSSDDSSSGGGPVAPPIDTTGSGGTVQRGALTLTVTVDPEDAALAQTAGVGVEGLTVRVQRRGAAESLRTVTTDAAGSVRLEGLLSGLYIVSVDRSLTSDELARLPAAEREASLLTGAASVPLTAPQGASATLPLVATRRGSLVISELFSLTTTSSSSPYGFGTYIEVYNNADTTVYLDGVLIAKTTISMHAGFVNEYPCAEVKVVQRLDPERLWVIRFWQYPGNGGEYAVAPGEARVFAMDALNHDLASPNSGQVDLSRAHFEEVASDGDTDNVTVPNMIRWFGGTGMFGRGSAHDHGVTWALATLPPGASSMNFSVRS